MTNSDASTAYSQEIARLHQQLEAVQLPQALELKVTDMLHRLSRASQFGNFSEEYERTSHYIDWISKIPWDKTTEDQIDLDQAKQILDEHHYGLETVKQRILEFLATVKLNNQKQSDELSPTAPAPILCLIGLAGTGKTTFAYSLAQAMNRNFARIPFGGLGSARDLRGQSRLHLDAEPGYVIKALIEAGSRNPVILLDELDRIAQAARADIMGVLLALLDPGQNKAYIDHYLDFPINLNPVLFIATANNTDNLSTAVQNRLEIIHMPTYSDQEKIIIAQKYLIPEAVKAAGLPPDSLIIDDNLWPLIVRPLGFDSGIRILKRAVDQMVRKTAFLVVKQGVAQVHITQANLKEYIEEYY